MRIVSLVLLSLLSTSVLSDWQLDPDASQLHFVSTKNTHVTEVHSFKTLSGAIDQKGNAKVSIDLTSVDTKIGIRDTRMQEMLFDVAQFPTAEVIATIPEDALAMPAGKTVEVNLPARLTLSGTTQDIQLALRVSMSNGQLVATTIQPVLVNARDFGWVEGINALREIAGLKAIGYVVPVTFSVTFNSQS